MRYGKLAPSLPSGLGDFSIYGAALREPPASLVRNYVHSYGMDGNDRFGDCTIAAAAHMIKLWDAETRLGDFVPSRSQCVATYLQLTGGTDSGLVVSDVLAHWRSSGLWGDRIVGYAPVKVSDTRSLKQAIAYYGGAYVGMNLPGNAEDQFRAGQPWDESAAGSLGGHCVPFIGYDSDYLYAVTWGAVQRATWAWWARNGDEAWCLLPQQFAETGGFGALRLAALQADLPTV